MTRDCAVCGHGVARERYRFGAVRGVICPACASSLGVVLTDWMQQRMRDLQTERRQRARAESAALLELELLPVVACRPGHARGRA